MAKVIKELTVEINIETLKLILDKLSVLENRISILEADNGMTSSVLNKLLHQS